MFVQIFRYGIVGVISNFLGYFLYLAFTWSWLEPKVAVTLLYPVGVISAYLGHAKYVFTQNRKAAHYFARYIIAHLLGYNVNLVTLYVFVDILAYPHQLIQLVAIFFVAGILFLLFKYYVFSSQ